jgi:23S rRNA (adenine2503-C2)-methyltransferase
MTETAPKFLSDLSAVHEWIKTTGLPSYRGEQIERWLSQTPIQTIDEMTDLPKPLRRQLAEQFSFWSTEIARHQNSSDGTEKLLVRLADGASVECVLLRDGIRRTVCLSSQVGCAMGCVFCASGLDGVERSLQDFEIVEQMLRLQRLLPAGERISHIVMMGMGEPLANLSNVLSALAFASSTKGLGISPRRITLSTVGIPAGILRLAELNHPYHLAISLHAPTDELRNQLVPVNRNIGIDAIIASAEQYFRSTGRRITFEYVLLAGINDQPIHAEQLVQRLAGSGTLLNVIPYNPVAGLPYRTPTSEAIKAFRQVLIRGRINVQFRERKGDQIEAACGQLRRTLVPLARLASSSTSTLSGRGPAA